MLRLWVWLRAPAGTGLLLLLASLCALVLANSPAAPAYRAWLKMPLSVGIAPHALTLSVQGWVNDAAMSLFFLQVTLEIRHELTHGRLHPLARAVLPGIAALGGMAVPAALFFAVSRHDPAARAGWGSVIATDIAFPLAVLAALGSRVPPGLKAFLAALAVLDDLLAIVVIALFYGQPPRLMPLLAAAGICAIMALLARARLRHARAYVALFPLLWLAFEESGLHATLAGVAFALIIPGEARAAHLPAPTHRMARICGLLSSVVILPAFGLANAGIAFDRLPDGAITSPLALAILAGLVLGKPLGVMAATETALRLGVGALPEGLSRRTLWGGAVLCGIGFTISLFIAGLAFPPGPERATAKLAIFAASLISTALGTALLWRRPPA